MFSVGAWHKGRRVTAQNRSNTLYLLRDHLGGDSNGDHEEDDGDGNGDDDDGGRLMGVIIRYIEVVLTIVHDDDDGGKL